MGIHDNNTKCSIKGVGVYLLMQRCMMSFLKTALEKPSRKSKNHVCVCVCVCVCVLKR